MQPKYKHNTKKYKHTLAETQFSIYLRKRKCYYTQSLTRKYKPNHQRV